jgi:hypothetical protein
MDTRIYQKLLIIFLSCFFALGGCTNQESPMPVITNRPSHNTNLPQPIVSNQESIRESTYTNIQRAWIPLSTVEKDWTAIIIHHSATDRGNAAIFDKDHRENHGWDGVGYDFVIGNGTNSGDGQVEVTFRWRQQITGAHCKTPDNWANEDGIGICLVGNFNNYLPTNRQMQSLAELTRFLQKRYNIPKSSIYGHKNTRGARVTDCPGHMFPMARFKSMLGS